MIAVGDPVLMGADVDVLDGVGGADECVVDVVPRLRVPSPPERGVWFRAALIVPVEVVGAGESGGFQVVHEVASQPTELLKSAG